MNNFYFSSILLPPPHHHSSFDALLLRTRWRIGHKDATQRTQNLPKHSNSVRKQSRLNIIQLSGRGPFKRHRRKMFFTNLFCKSFYGTWWSYTNVWVVFLNGTLQASFCLFSVFSNKQYDFYNKLCQPSIHCLDLNPRPLEHKSTHVTTRPGGYFGSPMFLLNL